MSKTIYDINVNGKHFNNPCEACEYISHCHDVTDYTWKKTTVPDDEDDEDDNKAYADPDAVEAAQKAARKAVKVVYKLIDSSKKEAGGTLNDTEGCRGPVEYNELATENFNIQNRTLIPYIDEEEYCDIDVDYIDLNEDNIRRAIDKTTARYEKDNHYDMERYTQAILSIFNTGVNFKKFITLLKDKASWCEQRATTLDEQYNKYICFASQMRSDAFDRKSKYDRYYSCTSERIDNKCVELLWSEAINTASIYIQYRAASNWCQDILDAFAAACEADKHLKASIGNHLNTYLGKYYK